jgi:2-hydroxy-6-oxonona-2,4-dienedioate hydrolase
MVSNQIGDLKSIWIRVGGLPIHARVSVSSNACTRTPDIVLIHGLVISSRYMIPTAKRLAPYCRVFAPDLPGFGKSGKPSRVLNVPELADALISWMDAIRLEQAVLLGNSLGCQILVDVAVRYPARVVRAVLTAPTVDPNARTAKEQIKRWLMDWPREKSSLILPQLMDYYSAGIRRTLHTLRYALEDRIEEKLPNVQVPTLVVCGSRDPLVPRLWAEEVTRLLQIGRLVIIPEAAHALNYSAAEKLINVVLPFLYEDDKKAVKNLLSSFESV